MTYSILTLMFKYDLLQYLRVVVIHVKKQKQNIVGSTNFKRYCVLYVCPFAINNPYRKYK